MSTSGQCIGCKNYTMMATCRAFPDKIPYEIISGHFIHTKPYPGDQGIMYDPIDPDEEDEVAEEQKAIMAPSALDRLPYLDFSQITKEGRKAETTSRNTGSTTEAKQIKERAQRNAARAEVGLKVGDPREADHKNPISNGGSNRSDNIRAVSQATNRRKGAKN